MVHEKVETIMNIIYKKIINEYSLVYEIKEKTTNVILNKRKITGSNIGGGNVWKYKR